MANEVTLCTKYFLFFSNVFFWAIGLIMLGIGLWAWSEKGFFDNITIISSLPLDPIIVLIIVSVVTILLSFAGCLGSLRENLTLLKCFSVCLGIIFFVELIAGILGFAYKDWFDMKFALFINKTITDYRSDPDLQNIIDFSQDYLQCCGGALGPADWENNVYFNCSSKITVNNISYTPREACGVPFSCCIRDNPVINTQCGFGVRLPSVSAAERASKIYTMNCISSFEDWLKMNLYTLAGIAIGLALMQILPLCFTQTLMSEIRAVRARWEKQHGRSEGKKLKMKPAHPGSHGPLLIPQRTAITPSGFLATRPEEAEMLFRGCKVVPGRFGRPDESVTPTKARSMSDILSV